MTNIATKPIAEAENEMKSTVIFSPLYQQSMIGKDYRKKVLSFLIVLAWLIIIISPSNAHAQNTAQAGSADNAIRSSSRVDPSTRAMSIQIPLKNYPGRGMSLPITLNYSSKVWRMENVGVYWSACGGENGGGRWVTKMEARYGQYSVSGWTMSLGIPQIEWPKDNDVYNWNGHPVCLECHSPQWSASNYWVIDRLYLHMPDGATFEMRKGDTPHLWPVNRTGKFYAVDDSRLIYDADNSILYMPDGSRYEIGSTTTKLIDRNGNTMVYNASAGQWADTLGRTIPIPAMGYTSTYSPPGTSGSYIFRWSNLSEALTVSQQLKYNGEVIAGSAPGVCGDPAGVPPPGSLWGTSEDGTVLQTTNQPFNPVVLHEIELPNGSKYHFTYNIYGEIDKIELPAGGTEEFTYEPAGVISENTSGRTNRGVKDHKIRPINGSSTGEQHWQYSTSHVLSQDQTYAIYKMRQTAPDSSYTERYLFNGPPPPDRRTGTRIPLFGFDDVRNGRPFDEQVFSPTGQLLRRKLTQWDISSTEVQGPTPPHPSSTPIKATATRYPKVKKEVSIISEPGANPAPTQALWTATTYNYDQVSQALNVTRITQYGFAIVDLFTAQNGAIDSFVTSSSLAISTTEMNYLDQQSYKERNMTELLQLKTIRKGEVSGPIVAQTETKYDEADYPIITYGTVSGWTDPQNAPRGNVTTVKKLRDVSTSYFVVTHTQYDQCGSVKKTTDARGYVSEIDYTDSFSDQTPATPTYAYPTSTTTPVPDSTGAHGSQVAFTTSSVYLFSTGHVASTTDANNKTTTFEYNDPLNRLKKVIRPAGGGWTSYEYGDAGGNIYTRTQTAQRVTQSGTVVNDAYQYFDGLGRPKYSFKGEGGTWIGEETKYDMMGRIEKTSNPYRTSTLATSASSPEWTLNTYDNLGRVRIVTTPDGSQVVTDYNLNTSGTLATVVTVTDAAGKLRKSFNDSAGRPIKVTEPDAANSLNTSNAPVTTYEYNVLGNLEKVTQDDQVRTFSYNALSQLKSATNPESGTITYSYDDNGNLTVKTDARPVTTLYTYDALNRVIVRSYSDSPQTPQVDYFYDGVGKPAQVSSVPNAKGRLTAMKSSISETYYVNYDGLGRIMEHWQNTIGATQPYVMKYDYDLTGNMIWQQYPSGRVVQTDYDESGRIAGVKNGSGSYYAGAAPTDATNRIQYTPHGAIEKMKLGNGLWEHTVFNSRLQPKEIGLGSQGDNSSLLKLEYAYNTPGLTNNNGNILSQIITVPTIGTAAGFTATQTYTYDELNRLKSMSESDGLSQTYSYDRWGNRAVVAGYVEQQAKLTTQTALSDFKSNNRIKTYDNNQWYDAAGNLKQVPGHSYDYDAENHVVTHDDALTVGVVDNQYRYDGNGRRVKRVNGNVTTIFVYNVLGQMVAEYTDDTTPQTSGTSYFTQDSLGTPRVITSQTGEIISRHDYLPFGEELTTNGSRRTSGQKYVGDADSIKQKFTGKERDAETELDYFNARYYSSTQGRFTSVDPSNAGAKATDPQSWNGYSYALNNPLTYIDSNGKWPVWTHNWIVDHALPRLSSDQRDLIKWASTSMDFPPGSWGPDTSQENAYQHGLRAKGQTVEQAQKETRDWILFNVHLARTFPDADLRLVSFGMAFHAITDMTSPSHEGFQIYGTVTERDPRDFQDRGRVVDGTDVIAHMAGDILGFNLQRQGMAIGATAALYEGTYGTQALQQATGGIAFGSRNDPMVQSISRNFDQLGRLPGNGAIEVQKAAALQDYRIGLARGRKMVTDFLGQLGTW